MTISSLFPFKAVNPNRGLKGSVIDTDRLALEERMRDYFSTSSFEELQKRHPILCTKRAEYYPQKTRKALLTDSRFDSRQSVALCRISM